MEWWVVVMMSATHKERPILGCSSRRTSGSKTHKDSQSFKVHYFRDTNTPNLSTPQSFGSFLHVKLFFFWEHPSPLDSSTEILKLKVLTICRCGTSDRRRQENIGSRVGHKYFEQQFRTPEKIDEQYYCTQFLLPFFLLGALYPVTASNGGAGGVFLDGTGGSYHSQW